MTNLLLHRFVRTLLVLISIFHLNSISAAPLLDLALPQTSFTVLAGGNIEVSGVITNRTASTIASDEMILNFNDFDIAAINPTQLLGNDYFTLAPFTFSNSTTLFSVDIDPLAANGVYSLLVTLQDFAGNFSDSMLVTLNVQSSEAPIPETPTALLIGLGILVMLRVLKFGRAA